ncbi:hypothetical protein B0H14DRAFT_2892424 [Mycena olivaceomarginata]|nr:hypothetical protein B0H14DRAFT_2892424 [Mycena olivaceomarginata]
MLVHTLRSKYWHSTELSARSRDAVRFQERRPMCAMPHVILLCRQFLGGSDADSAMAPSSSQRAFGAWMQMQINTVRYREFLALLRAAHPLRYCVLSALKRPHARPKRPVVRARKVPSLSASFLCAPSPSSSYSPLPRRTTLHCLPSSLATWSSGNITVFVEHIVRYELGI